MEGLVLLIFEALNALLAPLLIALGGLVALGFSFSGSLLIQGLAAVSRRRATTPALPATVAPVVLSRAPRRWLLRVALGTTGLLLLGWILLEFVLFQSIVKGATDRLLKRSGIEMSYKSATGYFSTGRFLLSGVAVRRSSSEQDSFDLQLNQLEIDVRLVSLLRSEVSFQRLRMQGAQGRYDRLGGSERKPRKPFTSDLLEIVDADIHWVFHRKDKADLPVPLKVERLIVRPFESENAAFCVLFRGTGNGTLAGSPWHIAGEGDGYGRHTSWTADGIPVGLLSGFLGEPFDWLESGTVDVRVTDAWRRDGKTEVDLRWKLLFHELKVTVPERVEGLKRRLGDAVAGLANRHPKELPLEFTLTLDEKGLMGRMSLETLELWDALAAGLIDELASRSGLAAETIRDLGRAGWGKLKGLLEKRASGKR